MKLSNTVGHFVGKYGWEKTIDIMERAGYDAVDTDFCGFTSEQYAGGHWASDVYLENAHSLRRRLDASKLVCNQIHAPFLFSVKTWNENLEDICIPYTVRSMEIASIIGADVCVVHPLHHFVYQGHEEEIFEKNMKFYSVLAEAAHRLGVRVGVENMWQRDQKRNCICHDTCSRSEEFVRYIDTLNDPAVVACLDVGHIDLIQREDNVVDVIHTLGHDRLHALHVHDNNYRDDQHLMPFSGKMNWQELCKALGEIDYDGDFTYEVGGAFFGTVPEEFIVQTTAYSVQIGRYLMSIIDANRPKK